jgi:hypothetical protein
MRLYFTDNTPTSALALEHLSHLPIIIDYSSVAWSASTQERLISALKYPDRVCGIVIRGGIKQWNLLKIMETLDLLLPALEGLELDNVTVVQVGRVLMTSIQSLRHLRLAGTSLLSFFPVLSATRAIVDLTLSIDTVLRLENGESLLTHLQRMPHLRNLQVSTRFYPPEEMPSIMSVLLAELNCFRFYGECAEIEWFVAGLVTPSGPSLRELNISAYDGSGTLHIPYVSEFIRVAEIVFFAAQLSISGMGFTISLIAHPHSIEDLPFKRVSIMTPFKAHPGGASSTMLATIEDVFFSLSIPITYSVPSLVDLAPWCQFFEEFRNVKVLRLHQGLEKQVADMLRQLTMNPPLAREGVYSNAIIPSDMPINSNWSQLTFGIFPSLEEIIVYARTSGTWIDETVRASVLESFAPFTAARHEAGRPVKVFWNADRVVPRYFIS